MTAHDLVTLGFAQRDGDLLAPDGTRVCLVPLEGSRCFRLVVTLPTGGVVSLVTAAVAIKVEAP